MFVKKGDIKDGIIAILVGYVVTDLLLTYTSRNHNGVIETFRQGVNEDSWPLLAIGLATVVLTFLLTKRAKEMM